MEAKKALEQIKSLFNKTFSYLNTDKSPRIPNLNTENIIKQFCDKNIIDVLFRYGHIGRPSDLKNKILELNTHVKNMLKGPDGLMYFSRNGTTKSQHNQTFLDSIIAKIEKSENPCYLGTIPKNKWVEYICFHHRY